MTVALTGISPDDEERGATAVVHIDLNELARGENEQTEWKENVADVDDVVATLSAFANDLQNLGGGYVVCGVREDQDSDRIEVASPGSLPTGVDIESIRRGEASPRWRNQSLAWFVSRLRLGQAEGISEVLQSMRQEGCPSPGFEADQVRVVCTLPAHLRHAALRDLPFG